MSTYSHRPDDLASTRNRTSPPPGSGSADDTPEEVISISGAGDALALVQHTFGFLPEDSLVVVGLHGTRVGAHLRIDLRAGADHPEGLAQWVCDHLAGPRVSPRPDGAVIYLFVGEAPAPPTWDDPSLRPYAALHASLTAALRDQHEIRVEQSWWVGDGHIRDYDCLDSRCCAYPGQDVQAAAASVLHAHMVYRGRILRTPRQVVDDFLAPAASPSDQTVDAVAAEQAHLGLDVADSQGAQQALWVWDQMIQDEVREREGREPPERPGLPAGDESERIEAWADEHRDQLSMMVGSLSQGDVPDAVLVLAADGLDVAALGHEVIRTCRDVPGAAGEDAGAAGGLAALARRWAEHAQPCREGAGATAASIEDQRRLIEAHLERFHATLQGATGERPRWERLDALAGILSQLQPMLVAEQKAETLALMSWIEWARGRGTLSGAYLDRCLHLVPGHQVGRMRKTDRGIGRICPWAMVREHSWGISRTGA
ncbi:DUF4192 family protein [Nesterenkonia sp. HG001]|uniref:DUF4192 family protein n=1 Tax=Nesterenkonia sp. HG001 TaxID=2983207 RepID=UPI002AC517ED|nr:DUF4192 family protein [Nesterenkonia sp. HG001]MDZ5078440.1 DUF4192 domain-containing protein [Nesterenkonia sp. HG001]